ncbi:hypothetical protein BDZ91DRAFT_63235 [Kalaharituber pfeilii]|nr:hypothetical protein BDZ91DRAFT_63235 [Kalaharituber pfeilii]
MRRNRRKIGTKLQFGMQIALSTAVSLTPQVSSSLSTLNKGRDSSKTPREHQEDPLLTDLQNATIKELMTKAQLAMEEFQSRNKKAIAVEDIVGKVATRIKQLLSTGNIMVQHDPFIASLVWGSFNLLLQVVINDYETMTKLAEMINNYMEASKTYHSYWKIYEHSQLKSAQHVLQILRLLEKDFRCFTYAARRYYFTRNSMVRIARSAVENFSVEFQPITDEIKDRVDRLERAVQAAKLDEDRRLKVLNWLSTLPYQDAHKAATHKWTKGTCNWIANKDEFKEWNCIPSPAVLWVHGHVGLGKTILM